MEQYLAGSLISFVYFSIGHLVKIHFHLILLGEAVSVKIIDTFQYLDGGSKIHLK